MATLDTKYINVGSSGSIYGFTNASIYFSFGDIADSQDGTTNADLDGVYNGADVTTLYNIVNTTATPNTNTLSLTLTGSRANSGWDTMSIGGSSNSVNRSDATYSYDSTSNTTNWIWSNTYVSENFFGTTNNADKEVIWATSSGGGGGGSTPTYSITAPTSIDEGSTGTISITTTNVSNSTELFWAVQPSGDFGTSTGSEFISGNSASFTLTPTSDSETEGAETATVVLYTDSARTNNVASDSFTINDTSTGGSGGSTGGGSGGSSNYGIEINSVASSPAAVFGVNFRTSNIQKFSNSTITGNGGTVSFTNIGSDATDSSKVVVVVDAGWHSSSGTFPVSRSTANGGTVTVTNNRTSDATVKIIIVRVA